MSSNLLSSKQKNIRENQRSKNFKDLENKEQKTQIAGTRNETVYSPSSLPNIKKIIRKSTNNNIHINLTIQMNWTSCF
jgi:hypothetical protein